MIIDDDNDGIDNCSNNDNNRCQWNKSFCAGSCGTIILLCGLVMLALDDNNDDNNDIKQMIMTTEL